MTNIIFSLSICINRILHKKVDKSSTALTHIGNSSLNSVWLILCSVSNIENNNLSTVAIFCCEGKLGIEFCLRKLVCEINSL